MFYLLLIFSAPSADDVKTTKITQAGLPISIEIKFSCCLENYPPYFLVLSRVAVLKVRGTSWNYLKILFRSLSFLLRYSRLEQKMSAMVLSTA